MAVEKLMGGMTVTKLPPKLQLYLICSPALDLNLRFLPKDGGLYDQNYDDMLYFLFIERRIKEVMSRKKSGA